MNIVAKDGVEITVGDQTWSNIRKFPWSQQITAGKYRIRAKAAGIRELSIPQFVVRADRENECLLEPVVLPSVVRFVSNRKETNIAFGELSCSPEEEKPCETFREEGCQGIRHCAQLMRKV